jgi:Fe-S cluster assembly protein SufD
METVVMSKKEQFLRNMVSAESPTHHSAIENALKKIETLDFPDRKTEDWKYTKVNKIISFEWPKLETNTSVFPSDFSIEGDRRKIFIINGKLDTTSSDIKNERGLKLSVDGSFSSSFGKKTADSDSIFTHINTAYHTAAVDVHLSPNINLEAPIDVYVYNTRALISQPRINFLAEENSSAEINLFTFSSSEEAGSFVNIVVEGEVKKGANITLNKIQHEASAAKQIATEEIYQHAESEFTINTVTLSGGFVRNGLNIYVDGENCKTHLYGLYLLKGNQHVDNHTKVDHLKANCESNEIYKGVIDESATAVFNGKVYVRPDSQKINAFQNNRNIVMTDTAAVYTKPELEIYADDVKCSHGCTVGQLDEKALFYLKARGMSEKKAKKLLIAAFAGDVLNNIASEPVRNKVNQLLNNLYGWEM